MTSLCKLSLVLLVSSSGIALAADLPTMRMPPMLAAAPVASWTDFYAGSFFAGSSTRFVSSSQGVSLGVTQTGHSTGALAGYAMQSGSYVFGVEGDLSQNYVKGENAGVGALTAHAAQSLHTAHLRARFGYDMGAFLPFVAGGLTYAETAVLVPASGETKGLNRTSLGWNIGAGVDWKVPLPIIGDAILRAEYLYEGLPSRTYTYDSTAAAIGMKANAHQLRVALISTPKMRDWRAPHMDAADWSGAYAGVLAGYGKDRVRTSTASASSSLDADGGFGGLYAGRNFVFGNLVAGFESSTMLASGKGDGTVPGTTDTHSYREYFTTDIRGRAGYAFGRFLPFVAAGGAFGRSEQSDTTTLAHRAKISSRAWSIGAGVDYMLTECVSARVEYQRKTSFKDADINFNGVTMSQSRSADLLRAGFAWHFH